MQATATNDNNYPSNCEIPPGSNKNPPARQKETPGIIQMPLATIHKHLGTPTNVVCSGPLHRVNSPETSERCRTVRAPCAHHATTPSRGQTGVPAGTSQYLADMPLGWPSGWSQCFHCDRLCIRLCTMRKQESIWVEMSLMKTDEIVPPPWTDQAAASVTSILADEVAGEKIIKRRLATSALL